MPNVAFHTSVLVEQVVHGLRIRPRAWYADATVGGGGHAWEIVKRGGHVLGIDADPHAVRAADVFLRQQAAKTRIAGDWVMRRGSFAEITQIAAACGMTRCNGVLFDLGVSTYQIKKSGRGFSFGTDEPLDMRMNPNTALPTAADIINTASQEELYEIFARFGEEQLAEPIAHAVVGARAVTPITHTVPLAQLVAGVYQRHHKTRTIHPATKVFQALRIAVNSELSVLRQALPQAVALLVSGGRIAVISFHSLEDRIVKQTLATQPVRVLTKKPIVANTDEVTKNRRARGAKLRIAEKL